MNLFYIHLTLLFVSLPQEQLSISLVNSSEAEQQAKLQLTRLVNNYPVQPWLYTKDIVIDEKTWIPHSHPRLTLNSRYLDNDLKQLSTLMHEQLHWLQDLRSDQFETAMVRFRTLYPEVPVGKGKGARDTYSTYLHLIVCDLEFQVMAKLVSDAEARKVLSEWTHYTWIYDKVLNDPAVRKINEENGLVLDKL